MVGYYRGRRDGTGHGERETILEEDEKSNVVMRLWVKVTMGCRHTIGGERWRLHEEETKGVGMLLSLHAERDEEDCGH